MPTFPARSSSLRHNDEFPFDPKTAIKRDDDSDNWASNPPSPARKLPSEHPQSMGAQSVVSSKTTDSSSSLYKPLPHLPQEQPRSADDVFTSGTATPTLLTPPRSENNDDTPRASTQWPLPADRQSIYGPLPPTPSGPVPSNTPIAVAGNNEETAPRARANSAASGQIAHFGLQYIHPQLDGRVLEARLQQIRNAFPATVSLDDFPTVPTAAAPAHVDAAVAAKEMGEAGPDANISTRTSVISVLSTAASFVTAVEDVEGEVEGAAETEDEDDDLPSSDQVASASAALLLSSPDDNGKAKLGNSFGSVSSIDGTPHTPLRLGSSEMGSDNDSMTDGSEHENDVENDEHFSERCPNEAYLSKDDVCSIPFQVTPSAPPKLSCKLLEGKMVWEYDPWTSSYDAKWKSDPDIGAIKEIARNYYKICGLTNDKINIEFLAEGSFNKVYTVSSVDEDTKVTHECIFRCSLPGAPWYKTQSEVATMELVRRNTKIPIPKVFVFDSSMENALGLEWMMMEKINGKMYEDVEKDLGFDAKIRLYRQAAEWIDELSRLHFDKIGALYHNWSLPLSDKASYKIGPLNTTDFDADLRLDYPINRGPFASFEEYYNSHIHVILCEALDPRHKERVEAWNKQEEMEATGEEIEEEVPETRFTLKALDRIPQQSVALQSVLPTVLRGKQLGPGSTHLHHFDIAKRNILVDDNGNPLALIDWEISWATIPARIPRYPPLIIDEEVEEPEPWDPEEEKDEDRLEEELAWEETLLKREFDKRLEELASPHLKTGCDQDPVLQELNEVVTALDSLEDWSYIERMQEEQRKLF